jgi:Kef-type K+ transport system membrane component KefB/nucleotide-binding universal stress UspA family protein
MIAAGLPAARLVLLALLLIVAPGPLAAADGTQPSEAVFIAQIVLLLVCGRLLGEGMQRIGQPAVMGQLIAGILLGPSVLGALWPDLQHALFPSSREQKSMIDAVSQLGILMLLLLTGMETDLSVVRKSRRAAFAVSLTGIAVPFACGFALGEMLPDTILPNPGQRLITSLFLGTALSISSVKIVAMAVREMNFMRRTVGQVIVASAIIDDTIGWTIMAITFGLALHGGVDLPSVAKTVLGTALFLVASFTVGRHIVFRLILWANDHLVSEMPVITTILVITGVMALITHAIGVHTVLGAFVAGILIGQSPILTRHIDVQLRGLIVALFMPVFFGMAGLSTNLEVLRDPSLLLLSLGFIVIASVGKFTGAFLGGAIGGLTWRESLAVGCGMNARGSTEVIVASIGLSMGALSQNLFSMIVAMAIVTTMAMPPMLRWALARLPMRPDEQARLEREEFEAQGFVTNLERLLVAVDDSANGKFASRLAGLLASERRIPVTVLHVARDVAAAGKDPASAPGGENPETVLKSAAEMGGAADHRGAPEAASAAPVDITTRMREEPPDQAVATEAKKGYDLLVVGVGASKAGEAGVLDREIARLVAGFDGPYAIVIARGVHAADPSGSDLDMLAPVTGTAVSRRAAEVALALAHADPRASVTALHVATASPRKRSFAAPFADIGYDEGAILRDIAELADRYGVKLRTAVRRHSVPENAILRQLTLGKHNLVVMGVTRRPGDTLFFGNVAAAVLERSDRSVLLVSS